MEFLNDSGLNIYFDPEALHISFVDDPDRQFQQPQYSTRSFGALSDVLADPDCVAGDEQEIVYWMFRNMGLKGNEDLLDIHSARYDLSVFRPHQFAREPMKTSGHYHPDIWTGGPSYPEIYEVVYGNAVFLMQQVDDILAGPKDVDVKNCIALKCEQGQKAIMPPDFGHVTINMDTETPLITTNWVCADFDSVYEGVSQCQGFAWYYTADDGWIENPQYVCEVPNLRHATVADVEELRLRKGVPMYDIGCERPQLLAPVKRPHDYIDLLWKGIEFEDRADKQWKQDYIEQFRFNYCKS